MSIVGTLAAVSLETGAVLTVSTVVGPLYVECNGGEGRAASVALGRRVRCDIEWLGGGRFKLTSDVRLEHRQTIYL